MTFENCSLLSLVTFDGKDAVSVEVPNTFGVRYNDLDVTLYRHGSHLSHIRGFLSESDKRVLFQAMVVLHRLIRTGAV